MDAPRLGATLRALRIRRRLRQVDLARRAGVSDPTISRIERGRLAGVTLGSVDSVARALGVRLELRAWSAGADLDRLLNARHSALAEEVVPRLSAVGWTARPEVSFGIYGERGVIDLLAWHGRTRSLLVIELKTAIVDVGALLGTLDRKRRLAASVAAGLDWRPARVGTWLAVADSMTNRRQIAAHAATFRAVLPDGARQVREWLRAPDAALNGPPAALDPPQAALDPPQAALNPPRVALNALSFVTDRRQGGLRSGFAQPSRVPSRPRHPAHARGGAPGPHAHGVDAPRSG